MEAAPERRRSLVDEAERALRRWLAPGRHRAGDRLPPEHDLAAMLGVSRGTLRTALERLEDSGEIVRRQGSGTFVGRMSSGGAFSAGLEVLESYSSLAARQGLALSAVDIRFSRSAQEDDITAALGLARGHEAFTVQRTLVAGREPVAWMRDVLHPELPPLDEAELANQLSAGLMVLDALAATHVPVVFARTFVAARLAGPADEIGRALSLEAPTAALELAETIHVSSGDAVQHSFSVFAPGRIDLHVMRALSPAGPEAVPSRPEA